MKQQIEPHYVDFNTAKLLKEKGFGKWSGNIKTTDYCHGKYFHKKPSGYNLVNWKETDILFITGYDNWVNEYPYCDIWTYAPEQWQILEWLRINHGIHVEVSCTVYGEFWYANLKVCSKEVWEDLDKRHNILTAHHKFNNEHKSKKEAYSAAFDYILNELI